MTDRQKLERGLARFKQGLFYEAFSLFCDSDGLPESKFYIGLCFEKGDGVHKDLQEALKWFEVAAKMGHPSAMYRLGLCYETGSGTAKNLGRAKYWYELGAKAGNEGAADKLERMPSVPVDNPTRPIPEGRRIPDEVETPPKPSPGPVRREPVIKEENPSADEGDIVSENKDDKRPKERKAGKAKDIPILERTRNKRKKEKSGALLFRNSSSEKKLNKMSIAFLSLIGILVLGGLTFLSLSKNDEDKTDTVHPPEENSVELPDSIVVEDSIVAAEEDVDTCAVETDSFAVAEDDIPAIARKDSPKARNEKPVSSKAYKLGKIGTSNVMMYIPKFLTESTLKGTESVYSGYKTVKLITECRKYSGSPQYFIKMTGRGSRMEPTYNAAKENWAVESGYYENTLYYRKVVVDGGIAYYAYFQVPKGDTENGQAYQEIIRYIFDKNRFPFYR